MDTQSSAEGEFDLAVTVANLAVALGAEGYCANRPIG